MSLHDEHLQQALKNAPDNTAAPSDAVRQKVLDYADNTVLPARISFFKRCMNVFSDWRVTNWQLVGISTVASIFVVTVLLRGQLPDEPVWLNTDEQEIAQTEVEPEPATANASPPQESKLGASKKEITEEVVKDAGDSMLAATVEAKATSRAENKQAKAKKSLAVEKPIEAKPARQLAKEIEMPVMDFEDSVDAAPEMAPIENSPIIATEEADTFEDSAGGDTEEATAGMSRPEPVLKSRLAAKKQASPEALPASGAMRAKKDIQAGIFRILVAGSDWPATKPLLDDETGFQVQMIEGSGLKLSGDELETYNQTMRHWYRTN